LKPPPISKSKELLPNSNVKPNNSRLKSARPVCRRWTVRDKRRCPLLSQRLLNVKKTPVF
jgi:hypothetical protein